MATVDKRLRLSKLETALVLIEGMPFSMANDSESLRHTIRTMQRIASEGLKPDKDFACIRD
jgi:hypothetical protein